MFASDRLSKHLGLGHGSVGLRRLMSWRSYGFEISFGILLEARASALGVRVLVLSV